MSLDSRIYQFVSTWRTGYTFMDRFWVLSTQYLVFLMAIVVMLAMWKVIEPAARLGRFGLGALSFFGAWSATLGIGYIVQRARPFHALGTKPLVEMLFVTPSFPSGHSTTAFALATVGMMISRPLGVVLYVAACVVAFSRLYVGVHYLSDIVAGAMVGITIPLLVHWAAGQIGG